MEKAFREPLTLQTLDSNDQPPLLGLVGRRLVHTGNGRVYIIQSFAWMGATDEWGFIHAEEGNPDAVPLCRPQSHIDGNRSNGERRYVMITKAPVGPGIRGGAL